MQERLGIGEWEFIAAVCFLTLVFWVVRATSNVTLALLAKSEIQYLASVKSYLKREAKLACGQAMTG